MTPTTSRPPRSPRRRWPSLALLAVVVVAAIAFAMEWRWAWLAAVVGGAIVVLDLALRSIERRAISGVDRGASTSRGAVRAVVSLVVALGVIAIAVAGSLAQGWGWRTTAVAALASFALMSLITMPLLAATAGDLAEEERGADSGVHGGS